MYVCVYVLNVYWLVCMSVVMKVRSNCAIHNRIDHFNENITCIHYIIIVLLGLYYYLRAHNLLRPPPPPPPPMKILDPPLEQ